MNRGQYCDIEGEYLGWYITKKNVEGCVNLSGRLALADGIPSAVGGVAAALAISAKPFGTVSRGGISLRRAAAAFANALMLMAPFPCLASVQSYGDE